MFYHLPTENTLTAEQVGGMFGFNPEPSSDETLGSYNLFRIQESEPPHDLFSRFLPEVELKNNVAVQCWKQEWLELEEAKLIAKLKSQVIFDEYMEEIRNNNYLSITTFNLLLSNNSPYFSEVRNQVSSALDKLSDFLDAVNQTSETSEVKRLFEELTFR